MITREDWLNIAIILASIKGYAAGRSEDGCVPEWLDRVWDDMIGILGEYHE